MTTELRKLLRPICRRLAVRRALFFLVLGVYFGAVLAIPPMAPYFLFPHPPSIIFPLAILLTVPILILLLVLFLRIDDSHDAARLVDDYYNLQDRTATALSIVESGQTDPLRVFQVEDALQRLKQVDLRKVAPVRSPRGSAAAAILFIAAIGLIAWRQSHSDLPAAKIPAETADGSRDRAGVKPGQVTPNFSSPNQRIVDRYFQLLETQQERVSRPASAD